MSTQRRSGSGAAPGGVRWRAGVLGFAMRGGGVAVVVALTALAVPQAASAQDISVGGQLRPRVEHQTTAPAAATPDPFTSLRTRAHLQGRMGPRLRGFVQLQDVRGWGEVPGSFPNGGNGRTGLHQGYLEVGAWEADRLALRAGRQEVGFGGERLVGAVDWTQQARALDGLRTRVRLGAGVVDLFGFHVDERAASTPRDGSLFGAYATLPVGSEGAGGGRSAAGGERTLDLFALYNHLDGTAVGAGGAGAARTDQGTIGARLAGTGDVAYRVEAAYQFGERGGREVSAFLLGGRVGTTLSPRLGATLWYDYLSGSASPGDGPVRVFDTLLATNHKYYGFADLFTNIPVHTAGRGLQDLALKTSYQLKDDVTLGLDLHSFHLARSAGLASGRLGEEVDLTVRWRLGPRLELSGGLSRVFAGSALRELGRLDGDRTFSYLMLNTTF